MATQVQATASQIIKHAQTYDCAVITLILSSPEVAQPNGPNQYVFPVSQDQVLPDGTVIPGCPPFAIPGEPSEDELYDNIMVLARFWVGYMGLPCAESDIDLTVNYPG